MEGEGVGGERKARGARFRDIGGKAKRGLTAASLPPTNPTLPPCPGRKGYPIEEGLFLRSSYRLTRSSDSESPMARNACFSVSSSGELKKKSDWLAQFLNRLVTVVLDSSNSTV